MWNTFNQKGWADRSQGFFQADLQEIAEWDRLLRQLGLNDSQVLEALKSTGEAGERLRTFVPKALRYSFVPELVIKVVRCHTVEPLMVSTADQSAAAN